MSDDRAWSELSQDEQDALITAEQSNADSADAEAEQVEAGRIDAERWEPTEGVDDEQDAYAEGVDASPGGERP